MTKGVIYAWESIMPLTELGKFYYTDINGEDLSTEVCD